jgi:hypothetical protein
MFPNLPLYLSDAVPKQRANPADRRAVIAEHDKEVFQQFLRNDIIGNYDDFVGKVHESVDSSSRWNVLLRESGTYIYTVDAVECILRVSTSVLVSCDMSAAHLAPRANIRLLGRYKV